MPSSFKILQLSDCMLWTLESLVYSVIPRPDHGKHLGGKRDLQTLGSRSSSPSTQHCPALPSRQRPKGQMPTGYAGARNLRACWFCPIGGGADLYQKKGVCPRTAWAVTCGVRQIAHQL